MKGNGSIDESRSVRHLMDLLAIEGLSGRERKVAEAVRARLLAAGCKPGWIKHDQVQRKIPRDFEIGNLIVKLPGTRPGARRLFSGHLDTVPLCKGAVPVRKGRRIVSRTRTALGGDNRTAVACLVTLVESLLKHRVPHPPITLLFTVGEEIGLWGARFVSMADLGRPRMGFNIDGGVPTDLMVGALGADRWELQVLGKASHAGVHPDHGISATLIASRAIADVAARGYFGKIRKGKHRGSSNIGRFAGGEADNQVTRSVQITGESRSHDPKFIGRITDEYRKAFERAAKSVKNHKGRRGSVRFKARRMYAPFKLDPRSEVVRRAREASKSIGLKPRLKSADGGLDANWLNARGLPTVTFGAGQHSPHTEDEYVNVSEYLDGCRLAIALAAAE